MSLIREYTITATGIGPLSCKLIKYFYNSTYSEHAILINGPNQFTFQADIRRPNSARIYKIEYNHSCISTNGLIDEDTIRKLVMLSIWSLKSFFPEIAQIDLGRVDLHIYCEDDVRFSLNSEYILKYGKTWAEKLFGAVLYKTLYDEYREALTILDQPNDPYEFVSTIIYEMSGEEAEYRAATSPRNFIDSLRAKYGPDYFYKVGLWLERYIRMLRIIFYSDMWYIDESSLVGIMLELSTLDCSISESVAANVAVDSEQKLFSLVSDGNGSCVGYWDGES
jgi:hypothetical protein